MTRINDLTDFAYRCSLAPLLDSNINDMDKDKLIGLLFAKNDSLENEINQIQATIERQREKYNRRDER